MCVCVLEGKNSGGGGEGEFICDGLSTLTYRIQ